MYIKHIVLACCLGLSLPGFAADIDRLKQQSRTAVKALGGELKSTLQASIKTGGIMDAVAVCNQKAPQIGKAVSSQHNMRVARTSLRVRNSGNAPDAWEKSVLEQFERRKADGEDVKTMEYARIAEVDGKPVFRYMKAIPTGDLCLACHGESLPGPLAEKLNALYPNDRATGFRKGDIRGAFTVTRQLQD